MFFLVDLQEFLSFVWIISSYHLGLLFGDLVGFIYPGIPKTMAFKVFNGATIVFLRDLNNKNRSTFVLMVLEA